MRFSGGSVDLGSREFSKDVKAEGCFKVIDDSDGIVGECVRVMF